MQIELESNRSFIIKALLPIFFIGCFMTIFCIFGILLDVFEIRDNIYLLFIFLGYDMFFFGIILFAKCFRYMSYKFSESEIAIYRRGKLIEKINILDIEEIHFYRWKFRYIITIYAGALNEGGCWKLHLWLKNGTKKELAFFSVKDANMLKEKLYNDLIVY